VHELLYATEVAEDPEEDQALVLRLFLYALCDPGGKMMLTVLSGSH